MQIWYINYSLHFGSVETQKDCLYWKVVSTDIQRKFFFNSLLFFQLYLLVSKLYELSVNSTIFFLTSRKTEARFIFLRALSIVLHGKFISNSLILF